MLTVNREITEQSFHILPESEKNTVTLAALHLLTECHVVGNFLLFFKNI